VGLFVSLAFEASDANAARIRTEIADTDTGVFIRAANKPFNSMFLKLTFQSTSLFNPVRALPSDEQRV